MKRIAANVEAGPARNAFTVRSAQPPTVEWDSEADAVYVRFSRRAVASTIDQHAEKMNVEVDADAQGELVGIEAVGTTRFTLRSILEAAHVEAPNVDLSEARFTLASAVPA